MQIWQGCLDPNTHKFCKHDYTTIIQLIRNSHLQYNDVVRKTICSYKIEIIGKLGKLPSNRLTHDMLGN